MDDILRQTRREIEELAADSGSFSVTCAETGECPTPITGTRFETHDDAARAADLAREYRTALREHDPDVPEYRFVVTELPTDSLQMVGVRERTNDVRANGLPQTERSVTVTSDRDGAWLTMKNAPLVHLARDCGPVGDAAVGRQLESKL
ncbi:MULTISPECIES: hypothetical protein [unclassified Haladaptatus]|uniref:DUF7552 domain-containing protein n=1 Tax=unclassified Haladaptatus TaxID=2622732 RepID=UPI00209C6C9A|nr:MULTISPECIES: hypothetical protein [unclassified Haladaptatus]MCO8246593.1 hypothetical protein [Haladaptatus sp. AB643]MCO8256286.1 hypothetical protein [Haladaptatus sp. AB618]